MHAARWSIVLLVVFRLLDSTCARADDGGSARGWRYLIDKLVADGVPREQAEATFADPRVPPFTGLEFSLAPAEPRTLYRAFLRPRSVTAARRCLATYAGPLRAAERTRGVPASVLAAILHVESGCGHSTGSHPILPPLARLAMAMEPENLRRNLDRHLAGCDGTGAAVIERRTRERARVLEDTFYPEVRATFLLAAHMHMAPLDIRGSEGGAFGLPQFLPTSYFQYGVDGDGDGQVSLYDPADAIASCANYLASHGWRAGLSGSGRRGVVWSYNHSAAYIDTVLTLAQRIDAPQHATVRAVRREARVRTATARKAAPARSRFTTRS